MVEIRILGSFEVVTAGGTPLRFRDTTSESLLKFLVLHRNKHLPADLLIEQFWPYSSASAGRASLQAAVCHLRRALEPDLTRPADSHALVRSRFGYCLRTGQTGAVDYDHFLALAAAAADLGSSGDWPGAVAAANAARSLVRGELLLCEPYADWAEEARGEFRKQQAELSEWALTGLVRLHRWREAVELAQQALLLDPLREAYYRLLMTAYTALGEPALALRTFDQCRRRWVEEYGAEPSVATMAVYRQALT